MMNRLLFLNIFLAINFCGFSSPKLYTKTVENNRDTIVINGDMNTMYLFCPIRFLPKEKYLEKVEGLIRSDKISGITSLSVKMFFFIEDIEYYSGGLHIKIQTNKDTAIICNEFLAIFGGFKNFDFCINRKEISRYYDSYQYGGLNIYSVFAQKGVTCFKSLDERIPFYKGVINEYFYPNYTQDENISHLKDSIKLLNYRLTSLEKIIIEMDLKIDSLSVSKPVNNPQNLPKENHDQQSNFFWRKIIRKRDEE